MALAARTGGRDVVALILIATSAWQFLGADQTRAGRLESAASRGSASIHCGAPLRQLVR